jgi:hypothetical protein
MRNKITAILLYTSFIGCHLFATESGMQTISSFKKNPNHFYFGPEFFAFDLDTRFKGARIHGTEFFMGLKLGYERLKPDAFYFGIDILATRGLNGFHESYKGCPTPRANKVGFANIDLRFGYSLITDRWLMTPYFCYGAYAFGSRGHRHHIEGGMTYLGSGVKSRYEISRSFNVGLNARIFASIYTNYRFKFLDINQSNHRGQWGGEIGLPLIWYPGSHKRWDIQLEPYFLKLDFSQVQNIYGLRLLFGYHF